MTGSVQLLPTLYKYGLYEPLTWTIGYGNHGWEATISLYYGTLNGKKTTTIRKVKGVNIGRSNETSPLEQAKKEAEAEWLLKLKQGYKERLEDISPLITDINEILKPMKAQQFSEDKLKKNIGFPCIQQPKLNGLRAVLRWEDDYREGEGIFETREGKAILRSKEGIEYYMPHITDRLKKDFFINSYTGDLLAYDGELYNHRMKLNDIKASCPFKKDNKVYKSSKNPLAIVFVVFDMSIPEVKQSDRTGIYLEKILDYQTVTIHYTECYIIYNYEEALRNNEEYLKYGYEGSIFRNMEAYYEFGKRPITMMKLKKKKNTECRIIDIIEKNDTGGRVYITFILHNDINDHTFESVPYGDETQRWEYINNKLNYIGKLATVEFYERSGIKEVPFHSNVVTIREEADYDKNDLIPE